MKAITKYIVDVDYRKFEFVDGDEAFEFAQTAARTVTGENPVEILLVVEAEADGLS